MIEVFEHGSYRYRTREFPLTNHLEATKLRIESNLADNLLPRYCQGDDSASTLISVGYVLLASALADTRDPVDLSAITGFLEDFTEMIVSTMNAQNLWKTDFFNYLEFTVRRENASSGEIAEAFNNATHRFYEEDSPRGFLIKLELARARLVFGGELQNYIDYSFFDEFYT